MATQAAELLRGSALEQRRAITICHFTTAHTTLKSRSFHREFLPLAAGGIGVRYVAPMAAPARRDGVDFISLPQPENRLRRIFGPVTLLEKLLRQRASLYHFQDPQLLPLAFLLKLVFRRRVVYDAYEDFPSMAASSPRIPRVLRRAAAKIVAAVEKLAARSFDGIVTADPFTLRRLAHAGRNKKLVFYNFPNLDFFPHPPPRAKHFDVVYRGGISHRAGTFVLLDAVRLLSTRAKPPRLLLIGYFDGPAAEREVRERIRALGLESSVEIRGRLDHEDMAEALGDARIGVCPLQPVPKFLLNIPVKIFEYWACGLPVIASDLPPVRPFIRNSQAAFLFRPESSTELARSIAWLLNRPRWAARMGAYGREFVVRRFNNQGEVHRLRNFCERIAQMQ
ncbi:MAG TPA: glycosyltransferase [Candidatus Acidoferrales bacterium]|nr:glycosyltransferase [Candidatus Acidoferrales bacterium]